MSHLIFGHPVHHLLRVALWSGIGLVAGLVVAAIFHLTLRRYGQLGRELARRGWIPLALLGLLGGLYIGAFAVQHPAERVGSQYVVHVEQISWLHVALTRTAHILAVLVLASLALRWGTALLSDPRRPLVEVLRDPDARRAAALPALAALFVGTLSLPTALLLVALGLLAIGIAIAERATPGEKDDNEGQSDSSS